MSAKRDAHGRFIKGSGGGAPRTSSGPGGTAKITDVDHGAKALRETLEAFGHVRIEVGVLEKDGAQVHKSTTGEEPVTVIQVAAWHEFGTEDIPARSFLRAYVDENQARLRAMLSALAVSVATGKRTKADALEILGAKMVGEIQARIAAGIDPPLSPATIARKGSSVPLIDTGQLRSSISFRVRES